MSFSVCVSFLSCDALIGRGVLRDERSLAENGGVLLERVLTGELIDIGEEGPARDAGQRVLDPSASGQPTTAQG